MAYTMISMIHRRPRRLGALTILLVAVSLSCGDGPLQPLGPGQVDGVLVSPNGAEAAAVVVLSGIGIGAIEVDDGTAFVEADGNTTRLVIILENPGDIRFRVTVTERSEPPEVVVVEVADGSNQLRSAATEYRVEFTPIPDPVTPSVRRVP